MSEGRSLTLRKKANRKPQISGPQPVQKSAASKTQQSGLAPPKDRNGPSETSDLVKRRYSTRYNQLPDFSQGAPAVPNLPGQHKRSSRPGSPRRPLSGPASPPVFVDIDAIGDSNLQAEGYVTDLLSSASEHDIQEYQESLRKIKHRTSDDLQQNIYQNRMQFIKISKEAENLKTEMTLLRGLMSELTTTLGQTNAESTNSIKSPELNGDSFSRKKASRSSVANLENMWNIQLQTLWKTVEGSQKFLPAIPGRHIIMENGQWHELDSATWKPRRPVHIVLLNDHILVASKKRKRVDPNVPQQGPAPTKLVAEECWRLQDIELLDLANSVASGGSGEPAEGRAVAAAFTVRAGGKSFTYRHEKRDEAAKDELLLLFRKTVEELRRFIQTETEKASPQADTLNYFATRDPASAQKPEIIDNINSTKSRPDISIEVDGRQQNFRWVESQIDDLDIDIAVQQLDSAVASVEKLRAIAKNIKSNNIAHELISVKVDERASNIATILKRQLVDTPAFPEATKSKTSLLIRLGFEDLARESYLSARSKNVVSQARQCVFEGDLYRYIFQVSYVYFTIIKNTVLIYQTCFSPIMMSACVKWAKEHLETFNRILNRQLSSVENGGKVWRECMDVVWSQERQYLGEAGLDFREIIGRGLEEPGATRRSTQANYDRAQSRSKSRVRTPNKVQPVQQ